MNLIIHHNDDDGRCAAAIAFRELVPEGIVYPSRTVFVEYKHGYTIEKIEDDIAKDLKMIIIVDIAIDDEVIRFLKEIESVRDGNLPKIWWIDHHKSSIDYLESADKATKEFIKKNMNLFIRMGISGTLLTWIVAAIPDMYRDDIMKEAETREFFELADDRSAVAIIMKNIGSSGRKEVGVPMAIRFIDDWDVWRHTMRETRYFNLGFSTVTNKHPIADVWERLLYGDFNWLRNQYLKPGEMLFNYQEAQNKRNMSRAFECELEGVKILCLNGTGNSMVFGNKIKEYPAVCLFYYDGVIKKWRYSFYSDEESNVDVAKLAMKCAPHNSGGHFHAAGCTMDTCILK